MQPAREPRARRSTAWAATGVVACLGLGGLAAVEAAPVSAATGSVSVFGGRTPERAESSDSSAVELGMRFRPSLDGLVTGVRFYKSASNTGVHTGTIWTDSGSRLGTVTFTGETGSGWQSAVLPKPVAAKAGTTYVVSYHTNTGHYAADASFFQKATVAGPLTAPADAGAERNSVYSYGASAFPVKSWRSANYWVDVAFTPQAVASTPVPTPSLAPSPAPSTTTPPAAPAPATAMPDAASTGVPAGVALQASGGMTVSTPGAVVDAKDVRGTITVTAPGVVIRRSRFTGTGQGYAIRTTGSGSVRVEDCEFTGNYQDAAIAYDNWTMLRSELHGLPADGVKLGSNVLFQDNYVHDFDTTAGNHADGGQVQNGVRNTVVRHNSIMLTSSQNAALFLAPDLGPSTDGPLVVEDNLLGGGNYTVYVVDGNNGRYLIRNITFSGNRFTRTAKYGAVRANVPVTSIGNVYEDGQPVRF